MKLGYENLKSSLKSAAIGIDKVLDAIEMIIYLHRLSVSANNHSEARYFLKQLFQLADTLKSENVKQLAHSLQKEFLRLSGDSANFIDYFMCEKILMSSAYKPFYFQYDVN
jgi:hypothetical protein